MLSYSKQKQIEDFRTGFETNKKLYKEIEFDTRITEDTILKFFISMLNSLKPLIKNTKHKYKNITALDPCVRTFLTGFDTEGDGFLVYKVQDMNLIKKKLLKAYKIPISHEPEDQ
jgi:hypothetical protein